MTTKEQAKLLAQEAIEHAKTRGVTSTQLIQLAQALLDSLEREEKYKAALECCKRQRDERLFGFNKDLFKNDDEELEQILKGEV